MIRYSGFRYRRCEIVIWCSADFKQWGWAPEGKRPAALPYLAEVNAAKAARKWLNNAAQSGVIDLRKAGS